MERTISLATKRRRIVEPVSEISLIQCGKTQSCPEDRISDLPDEVLVSILSRLNIEQRVRTSVLARRWRYLGRFTRRLKFKYRGIEILSLREYRVKSREFVAWVNHNLRLHRGETIDEFIVIFCLDDKNFKGDIDGWINFAFQKRVKRLKLDFNCGWGNANWNYPLTAEILQGHRLDSLTSLSLCHVDVTEEVLQYFLSVCPFLEELTVSESEALVEFSVSGPSLKLKHLEITDVRNLKRMVICDLHLVSFKYSGPKDSLTIKGTPRLVSASFSRGYTRTIVENFIQESSYLHQLETLVLDFYYPEKKKCSSKITELRNLRKLELVLYPGVPGCLLCAGLLRASPLLNRLKIKFRRFKESTKEGKIQCPECTHKCLKVVELTGLVGCEVELEIASYILSCTSSLGKVIIDPHKESKLAREDPVEVQSVRTRARQHLEARLPLGTELVVL